MPQKNEHYRIDRGYSIIDVAIQDLDLLFSPMDPSPPSERDIDDSTESYILGALSEIGTKSPVKLVFHIPPAQLLATSSEHFTTTIHNYFAYRAWANRMSLHRLLRLGFQSLLIGVVFLILCILLRRFLEQNLEGGIGRIFGTGFDIIGWVAMWRPIEIFLYDWWPLALDRKRYLRLSEAPIDLKPLEEQSGGFRRRDIPTKARRPDTDRPDTDRPNANRSDGPIP